MTELEKHIQVAEQKWLNQLYCFCQQQFAKKHIPSHDHTHHIRVWKYSKEILNAINLTCNITYSSVESCLIASLFHDIGLTINLGENHGNESRNICTQYFENHSLIQPENFEEILDAIEKHDDKNYKHGNNESDSVLSILCNADDLDAFGYIGVIRYTEIYLLRGVNIENLPKMVIENLNKRYLNFEKTYKNFNQLFTKHKSRYLETRSFFETLLKELS